MDRGLSRHSPCLINSPKGEPGQTQEARLGQKEWRGQGRVERGDEPRFWIPKQQHNGKQHNQQLNLTDLRFHLQNKFEADY